MITIDDLACPMMIFDLDRDRIMKIKGGKQHNYSDDNNYYDNRAVALAFAYADGAETFTTAGTSVEIGRDFSQARSFAQAQSFS